MAEETKEKKETKTCQNCVWLNGTFRNDATCASTGITKDSEACKEYLSITPDVSKAVSVLNGLTGDQIMSVKHLIPIYAKAVQVERKPKVKVIDLTVGDKIKAKVKPDTDEDYVEGRVIMVTKGACRIMDDTGEVIRLNRVNPTLEMVEKKPEKKPPKEEK